MWIYSSEKLIVRADNLMVTIDCPPQILVVSDNRKDLISNADTRHPPNVVPMLGQRRRRLTNIETALGECLVFAGIATNPVCCTLCHILARSTFLSYLMFIGLYYINDFNFYFKILLVEYLQEGDFKNCFIHVKVVNIKLLFF